VRNSRDIFPTVNLLLSEPAFEGRRIATKDWHPPDHISFADNHLPPNNIPFQSSTSIENPDNTSEKYSTRLWPVHCVQDSRGAELVPELDVTKLDQVIEKGTDSRVEMYSAFRDLCRNPVVSDSGLSKTLKDEGVTHIYVVGLAFDYCVKWSAMDAKDLGFPNVCIIKEGTKAVDPKKDVETTKELESHGVKVVDMESEEVKRILKY
jgi:nicotinamidase-related amidase